MISTWKLSQRILYRTNYCLIRPSRRKFSLETKEDVEHEQNFKKSNIENGYLTVYKFSYIRYVSALSRLKKYQMFLTIAGIPTAVILAQNGIIDTEIVPATIFFGFSMCILLFASSCLCQRLIGFIYFNEEKNQVKVAYLDFWGNRKEKEMQLGDIIPFSETPVNYLTSHIYSPFQQFSDKEVLKINLKYGQIIHKKFFNKLFLLKSK